VEPIRNRVNELDELTANNSKMIKDVDARATEGIRLAHNKATEADQHALQAGQKAQAASQTAQQASSRLQTVEQVVGNLDDYKPANQTEIRYRAGTTTLSKNAKTALDEMAGNIQGQRGYIIQIQGFAPGRGEAAIQNSQTMAQSVARYLVIQHQVPNYRIFVAGMGNTPVQSADGKTERVRAGKVEVTLMKNSVDQLAQNASNASMPSDQSGIAGSTQPSSEPAPAQPSSGSVASPRPEPPQPTPPQQH
jgi:outer membrane protein OmpA-like peptidoglycan-associated protein